MVVKRLYILIKAKTTDFGVETGVMEVIEFHQEMLGRVFMALFGSQFNVDSRRVRGVFVVSI